LLTEASHHWPAEIARIPGAKVLFSGRSSSVFHVPTR
jgi:hypothetical protein